MDLREEGAGAIWANPTGLDTFSHGIAKGGAS